MTPEALQPTRFIDSDHPAIRAFAAERAGQGDDTARAVNLYYAVRDHVPYSLGSFHIEPDQLAASATLTAKSAYCVPKAILLAAVARASGIPARVGFADVRNHVTSPRIAALMDDDIFHWHAYTALWLNDRWVKATPAFDATLCARNNMGTLEFDGQTDSIFHPFDLSGRKTMEYVAFLGEFDDMPYDAFALAMHKHHGRLLKALDAERATAKRAASRSAT
ncbi:MAG: transglutaminase domain-containing protein [Pseudooceanicola sp.]|nr:transglutaminase domain-containing protein [Pseudooceanicola sp.]